MPAAEPTEAVEGYEALREDVLTGRRGPGLALFLQDGMACWMRAWKQIQAPRPREAGKRLEGAASVEVRSELVAILAQMALSPRGEG
jgi:hypothetical protein